MVIIFTQSFSFVYLSLSFEKHSFVNNVATLAKKELQLAIGTPMLVPIPVKDNDVPTVSRLTPTKISKIVIENLSLFILVYFLL